MKNKTTNKRQNLDIEQIQNMIDASLDTKIIPKLNQNQNKIKDKDLKLNLMSKNIEEIKIRNQAESVKLDNLTIEYKNYLN